MTFLQVFNKHVTEGVKVDYDVVKAIALEYAEVYSQQILKLAADNATMSSNLREDSNLANIWINRGSILNIQLPQHI